MATKRPTSWVTVAAECLREKPRPRARAHSVDSCEPGESIVGQAPVAATGHLRGSDMPALGELALVARSLAEGSEIVVAALRFPLALLAHGLQRNRRAQDCQQPQAAIERVCRFVVQLPVMTDSPTTSGH